RVSDRVNQRACQLRQMPKIRAIVATWGTSSAVSRNSPDAHVVWGSEPRHRWLPNLAARARRVSEIAFGGFGQRAQSASEAVSTSRLAVRSRRLIRSFFIRL